jgi:hypothetical protein
MRGAGVGLGTGVGEAAGVGEGVCAGASNGNFEATKPVAPSAGRNLTKVRLSTLFFVLFFFMVVGRSERLSTTKAPGHEADSYNW